jgi:DNA-binding transcriptional ArsR family regulator
MDIFFALAEPHRRSILEMLAGQGQLSATAIARRFQVSPPAISQHLKILREAGLVRMEKSAQQHLFTLNQDAMRELEEWARHLAGQYDERYQALERLLEAEDQTTGQLRSEKEKNHDSTGKRAEAGRRRKDDAHG